MSRIEENKQMIQKVEALFRKRVDISELKLHVLVDISKSLAVIADNIKKEENE